MRNLYTNTVSSELWDTLLSLMKMEELLPFRLVGGTALSLQLGHRVSVDIDLFTDAAYESVDFQVMDKLFQSHFPFVETIFWENTGFGKAYYIGNSRKNMIKVDMFYTDAFIRPAIEVDTIRMASIEDITAMKPT